MAGDQEQNLSKTQTLELDPSQALPSASFPVENCDPHLQYEVDRKKETQSRATLNMFFRDFRARRAAIVKALTVEAKEFYKLCDPVEENLCLYGHPDETWEVSFLDNPPEGPPDMPEPPVGLNLARDDMDENEWLALVALHSDAWLLALTFYLWARFSNQEESRKYRGELFSMIDTLPTIYEVVKGEGAAKKPTNDGAPINNHEPVSKLPSPPEEFFEGSSKRTRVA